ncbi:hypothetical protein BZG02_09070 [Labilibaculum filiforme]|uniref:Uncharacterized protein n=1 Tax=Labilibaculum filiforme TaxID=1940526 RepID=A0A2N3HZP1_9BACT|nr:hypothetical protein [Labilibaculum filiforme]PKQ63514.1 hypothetical protein BZG02_09070 [Labilibaculum filiforme]
MREITRYNYEEFFLDYLDGTLNSLQTIALEEFLIKNPDLKLELEEMDCSLFAMEDAVMDAEYLKEIPFRESFDDFCIARLEGDLSVENEIAFDAFVEKHESYRQENQLYKKTILHADTGVVFPAKEKLKKEARKLVYWTYFSRIGVAATIILLFSLWTTLYQFEGDHSNIENVTAKAEPVISKTKPVPNTKKSVGSLNSVIVEQAKVLPAEKSVPVSKYQKVVSIRNKEIKTEVIEEIEKRVDPLAISLDTKMIALTNSEDFKQELDIPKEELQVSSMVNNGLAQLGMSWKSSVPEKNAQNSVLYAIAKYGVDKLGELAGKNVQLEKKYDSTTEKTRIDFNTVGIGFSKTIK